MPARQLRCYRLHGFDLNSPIRMAAEESAASPSAMTLHVHANHELSAPTPSATVLSRFVVANGSEYSHLREEDGFLSSYFNKVQFRLSVDRLNVHAVIAPGVEAEWISILMAGSYPAFLLFLSGRVPLHASAVWLPRLSIAAGILGGPGSGKTTLAGALCLAGGSLISDDLLSLDEKGSCEPGSRELRLRQGGDELASRFGAGRSSTSPDGRRLVDAREKLPDRLPLGVLVQPVLDRQASQPTVQRLRGAAAFQAIANDPRVKGLAVPGWVHAAFEHAARLAREVPVYRVTLPYRDRDFGQLGEAMQALLGKLS